MREAGRKGKKDGEREEKRKERKESQAGRLSSGDGDQMRRQAGENQGMELEFYFKNKENPLKGHKPGEQHDLTVV